MQNLTKILEFINKIEKLKTVKRKVSISDNSRKESPAEHSWRLAIMVMIINDELKLEIDILKAIKMALVHDIVEIVAGDVFIIDENDKESNNVQRQKESLAAREIYSLLPVGMCDDVEKLWTEYEYGNSKEAFFVKALDKIEVIIQRNNLGVKNWERTDIHEKLLHWADKYVEKCPELKDFWRLVQNELVKQLK